MIIKTDNNQNVASKPYNVYNKALNYSRVDNSEDAARLES